MEIVKPQNNQTRVLLGTQKYIAGFEYKQSSFTVIKDMEDGCLYFNTLTDELVHFEGDERLSESFLVNNWFMIPSLMDEYSLFQMYTHLLEKNNPRSTYGKLDLCVIFLTMACNARCSYCYEKGIEASTMSEDTALDVAKWIQEKHGDNLTIQWFGGEPLLNQRVIDIITEYLNRESVDFTSTMITNGYLLDEVTEETVKGRWHLKSIQVTLDGTEKKHNKIKNYVYKGTNPYKKTIENIKKLAGYGVIVKVRLNVSKSNCDDLLKLVDELSEFRTERNIQVYAHPIYGDEGSDKAYIEVQNHIYEKFGYSYTFPKRKRIHCMADGGRAVCINTSGGLTLCEHFSSEEVYGTIYSKEYDQDILKSWLVPTGPEEKCRQCFYLPYCKRLKKCPAEMPCTKDILDFRKHSLERAMVDAYDKNRKR